MSPDELVGSFAEAWQSRRRASFSECCALDVHYEDPLSHGPCDGLDELGEHASKLWALMPDVRVTPSGEHLADGRFLCAPMHIQGTHRGGLPRVPRTGRRLSAQVLFYCELDPPGERLWRVRAFFDAYDAGVQLGILPAHGTVGERALMVLRGFGLRSR